MSDPANQNDTSIPNESTEDKTLPVSSDINITPAAADVVTVNTGDAALDLAYSFFSKVGLPADHAALAHAASTGDFALVEASLKDKGDVAKGYEPYLKIAKQQFARQKESAEKDVAASKASVFQAVGGEENWKTIRAWAAANATPDEAKAINAQLSAGGASALIAAKYLAGVHAKAQARVAPSGEVIKPGAARTAGSSVAPLSPSEFQRAVAQLSAKVGTNGLESNTDFQQLRQRRQAWKS
jgi:hypothetical protein